ncbi:hypothetical protein [Nafulsella turpanensis]|uniref:hypothetical protein n=1 Tax=Nafulsella turpanensis TaxID=1265690 RepID=UPI0003485A31|nr:hypothetical protein [Nafulsella turpanensis]
MARIEGPLLIRSSNTPVPAAANPKILIDSKTPDSRYIDPIYNRYQLWLPYGKDYRRQVQAKGYRPEAEDLKRITAPIWGAALTDE